MCATLYTKAWGYVFCIHSARLSRCPVSMMPRTRSRASFCVRECEKNTNSCGGLKNLCNFASLNRKGSMKKILFLLLLFVSGISFAQKDSLDVQSSQKNEIRKNEYIIIGYNDIQREREKMQEDSLTMAMRPIVTAHLNYYLNLIHSLKHNRDLSYLYYVVNELSEKISDEESCKAERLVDLRVDIKKAVDDLIINMREQSIYEQVRDLTRKNQKISSLNNALSNMSYLVTSNGSGLTNNTKILGGGVSAGTAAPPATAAVPAILILARTGVDYVASQRELEKSRILDEWKIQKQELSSLNDLISSKVKTTADLYRKYGLKESECVDGPLLEDFYEKLEEPNLQTRINRLTEDKTKRKFEIIPDYYYYLGMDYVENNEFDKAKPLFDEYIRLSNEYKVLKIDRNEKLGLVALVQIAYENDESEVDLKVKYICDNLPSNEMAYIACIYKYLELGKLEEAFNVLSLGLSNVKEDNGALVEFAMRNMNSIKGFKALNERIYDYILRCEHISLSDRLICEYHLYGKLLAPNKIFEITDGDWNEFYTFNIKSNSVLVEDTIEVIKESVKLLFPYNVEKKLISKNDLLDEYDELEEMDEKEQMKFISYFYTPTGEDEELFITRRNLINEKNKFKPASSNEKQDGDTDNNPVYFDLIQLLDHMDGKGAKQEDFINKFYNEACARMNDAKFVKAVGTDRAKNFFVDVADIFIEQRPVRQAPAHKVAKMSLEAARLITENVGKDCLNIILKTHPNLPNIQFKYTNQDGWSLQSIYFIKSEECELIYSVEETYN